MSQMINVAELKSVATPQSVARYFLGSPEKELNNALWYKSPFRRETAASFEVSSRGLHDFGTDTHYDVISFVQKLRHCGFKEAVEILCSIYGLEGREEDRELQRWLKQKQIENERYIAKVERFYLDLWGAVDKEDAENRECLKIFAGDFSDDTYKICLDRQCYIEGLKEHLVCYTNTFKDKEDLYKRYKRGEFPKWLMTRLQNYITLSTISDTIQRRNREY